MQNKHNIFTLALLTLISSMSYSAIGTKGNISEGTDAGKNVNGKNNIRYYVAVAQRFNRLKTLKSLLKF